MSGGEGSAGAGDRPARLRAAPGIVIPDYEPRVFVAIALDPELRYGLDAHLRANLAGEPLPGRSSPAENWHITLRFVGKVNQTGYEKLLAKLDEADLGSGFALGFAGLGAFPKPARATVLWLGVDRGAAELSRLAAVVEEATVSAGFIPGERPFHPHLTLSRIRPPQDVRPFIDQVPPFPLSQTVDHVTVFESHLGRGPAVYAPLARFALS